MRESTVARNYAEVLFALGERHRQHEALAAALDELAALVRMDDRVRRFLETPKVDAEAKKRALLEALRDRVPALFLNFVRVVLDKGRQRAFPEIAREYHALLDEHLGRVHVDVTLAREPDERTEEEIAAELSRMLGRTAIPHVRLDPRILGGIVVRYGDRILDGSLRRRLSTLRRRLLEAELPAGG